MTTAQIKTFLTAADTLSFSAAAEQLYISQPTVSRQIRAMEEELDAELFSREGNMLQLTLAGTTLREGLTELDRAYEALTTQVRSLAHGDAGMLRFGLMEDQQIDRRLIQTLEKFSAPERRITFVRMEMHELRMALREGKLDAACMIFQNDEEENDLCRMVNSEEPLCLASVRQLHFGQVYTIEELGARCGELGVSLLMPEEEKGKSLTQEVMARIRMNSQILPSVSHVADRRMIEPTVTAGFAVTCVNESSRLAADENIELCPLPFLLPVKKGILWYSGNNNPLFHEFLKQMEQ